MTKNVYVSYNYLDNNGNTGFGGIILTVKGYKNNQNFLDNAIKGIKEKGNYVEIIILNWQALDKEDK